MISYKTIRSLLTRLTLTDILYSHTAWTSFSTTTVYSTIQATGRKVEFKNVIKVAN